MKAVRIHAYGGPEQMRYEDVELGAPQPGEALVKHTAIGVNFADLHNCQGRYPLPSLPHALGGEAAGIVVDMIKNKFPDIRSMIQLLQQFKDSLKDENMKPKYQISIMYELFFKIKNIDID